MEQPGTAMVKNEGRGLLETWAEVVEDDTMDRTW